MVGFLEKGLLCRSFNSIGKPTTLFTATIDQPEQVILLHCKENSAPLIAAAIHGEPI